MVQKLILFALIVPVAALLGYVVANPGSTTNLMVVAVVVGTLLFPLLIRWHHLMAIFSVNLLVNAFFLPGQLPLWVVLSSLSAGMSWVAWLINRKEQVHWDSGLAFPLIILAIVVVSTAQITGGFGAQVLGGSQWGGKRYALVLGAIAAFFAISCKSISPKDVRLALFGFLASGWSAIAGNLIVLAGPGLYLLFSVFPFEYSTLMDDQAGLGLRRLTGFSVASYFGILLMMATYGLRGIFNVSRPGRLLLFVGLFVIGLLGGFRSFLIKLVVLCLFQFLLEGLFRPRYVISVVVVSTVLYCGLLGFSRQMPLSIQRALTIIPFVDLDPVAKQDAFGTLDWRLEMWKIVVPQVPRYLIVGKGYGFDATDYQITQMAVHTRGLPAYEHTLISGNYHSGPLTLVVPFGIWGVLLFGWFLVIAFRRLLTFYRNSPPELKGVNTFFLAWFCQLTVHYVVFYGQFDLDLVKFTSLVALAIAVNTGWRQKSVRPEHSPIVPTPRLAAA